MCRRHVCQQEHSILEVFIQFVEHLVSLSPSLCSYYYYIPFISCFVVAVFFPSGKSQKTKDNARKEENNHTPANKDVKLD